MSLVSQYESEGNEGLVLSFSVVGFCFAKGKGMCLRIPPFRNSCWEEFMVPM